MSSSPAPPHAAPGRRLTRWLLHPRARASLFGLLLIGFAVGVAVYMGVVNRYVHFSVHVDAPATVEPGGSAPLRVHIYRPDSRQRLRGTATWRDDRGNVLAESPVVTGVATPFSLPVPAITETVPTYQLEVRVDGEEEVRTAEVVLPFADRPALDAPSIAGLPSPGSQRRVRPQAAAERARVQRLRSDPADADLSVTIVPETGFPVRFLENRFLIRLTRRDGAPLSGHSGVARVVSDGEPIELRFTTDTFGLAELRVTPLDIDNWWIESEDAHNRLTRTQFEVVPGFDGLIARLDSPIVGLEDSLSLSVQTGLGAERWYYDVYSQGRWISTGLGRNPAGRHRLIPPGTRWPMGESTIRYATLQIYTTPFALAPQSSVRGLLIRQSSATDSDVARALLEELAQRELDRDYVRALRASGLPRSDTPTESIQRLVEFLLVRLLPTFIAPPAAYDDTAAQTDALLAETTAFRTRMHWLLALGVFGLLSWIVGRITVYTVQTRRRTRVFLAELDDDEATSLDETSLAEMRSAVIPISLAALTITAFFLGVLYMLAAM